MDLSLRFTTIFVQEIKVAVLKQMLFNFFSVKFMGENLSIGLQ